MTPEEQAHAAALGDFEPPTELRRHLSWVRVLAVFVVLAAVAGGIVWLRAGDDHRAAASPNSSFAPYVDATATPQFPFESPSQTAASNVVLGFVVSDHKTACQPSWGGAYTLSTAATDMDMDRRIARLRQLDGQVTVSFGGQANSELAIGCTDPSHLAAAYQSVIDRYSITTIDLDIEGDTASASAVDARRAAAIAMVQQAEHTAKHDIEVWLTLPVGPNGLTTSGQAVLDSMLAAHVTVAGVNAMTMDYGQPLAKGQTMADLAESSLTGLAGQIRSAYSKAKISLSTDQAWQHMGATPMIGQNDTPSEVFGLSDARALVAFVQAHHLRRLSMWSANRDQSCGPNYANVQVVSDNCSGVTQDANAFTKLFDGFTTNGSAPIGGDLSSSTPASSSMAPTAPDNPATSPYPIWNANIAYTANTKVVWQHNVYEAKWYTQGDTPDAPVASASQTPWTLIGPVLPGEHPSPTPTLAAGTYPAWSATTAYTAGKKVLYQGIGFQAKWYTKGDVPGVPSADPGGNPWKQLGA